LKGLLFSSCFAVEKASKKKAKPYKFRASKQRKPKGKPRSFFVSKVQNKEGFFVSCKEKKGTQPLCFKTKVFRVFSKQKKRNIK